MNFLRNHPMFKVTALLLGVGFAIFAFHFIAHLEHAHEEEAHECPVCQALAIFALLTVFAFFLSGVKQSFDFVKRNILFYYGWDFFPSITSRGPPSLS